MSSAAVVIWCFDSFFQFTKAQVYKPGGKKTKKTQNNQNLKTYTSDSIYLFSSILSNVTSSVKSISEDNSTFKQSDIQLHQLFNTKITIFTLSIQADRPAQTM